MDILLHLGIKENNFFNPEQILKKIKNFTNIDILYEVIEIFNILGFFCEITEINSKKYIYLYTNSNKKKPLSLIYIHSDKKSLTQEDIEIIFNPNLLEKFSNKGDSIYFKLISLYGYDLKESFLTIEDFYKLNIVLESENYIKSLIFSIYNNRPYVDLFPHNQQSYYNILNLWKQTKKACVVQATGTGKSFIIGKIASDFFDDEKLILSSSHYILEQLTDIFPWIKHKTKLMTYYKTLFLEEDELQDFKNLNPKLIILDEFHRCGAKKWAEGVEKIINLFPNAYILGTSATPVRYLDNNRNMAIEIFDSAIATNLSLSQSIVRKILPMPKYVTAFLTIESEISKIKEDININPYYLTKQDKTDSLITLLNNTIESTLSVSTLLKKYISFERNFVVFCQNAKHVKIMIPILKAHFKKAFGDSFNVNTFKVYSEYKHSDIEFYEFVNSSKEDFNLLFCIDKLNEGIHTPAVDGIILLRPTLSPIVFYQQIGRCLQVGFNASPLIFDFVDNVGNIHSADFANDIFRDVDKTNSLRKKYNLQSLDYQNFSDKIYDETLPILDILSEIEHSLGLTWESMYFRLIDYKDTFGDTNVPSKFKDIRLANWVSGQRQYFKKGLLPQSKVDKLNQIEFSWDVIEEAWLNKYEELCEFKDTYGHLYVRKDLNLALFSWIARQRKNYRIGILTKEKLEKLDKIGFIFNPFEHLWDEMYSQLLDYYNKYNTLDISNDVEFDKLKGWFYYQRSLYKKNALSKNQIKKLKDIGYSFNRHEDVWNTNYESLVKFHKIHNHVFISRNSEYSSLYYWFRRQKQKFIEGNLSDDKAKKLKLYIENS